MVKREGMKLTLLSDEHLKAIDAFGLRHKGASIDGGDISRPAVFIIDEKGVVRHSFFTENWRVRTRPKLLLAHLREL